MPKKKNVIKKTTVKTVGKPRNTGYRDFVAAFKSHYDNTGITLHGGRGIWAKRAGEMWKELKNKPDWRKKHIQVIDKVLAKEQKEYIPKQSVSFPPSFKKKEQDILENIGGRDHQWWDVKSTYGSWQEIESVDTSMDRLIVENGEGDKEIQNDITDDLDAALLYRGFKDLVKDEMIEPYSYLEFDRIEENENGGADTIYKLVESSTYEVRKHDKAKYLWSDKVQEKFPSVNKEEPGRSVKIEEKTKETPILSGPSGSSKRENRLNELLKIKQSLMDDIRFAKEMGEDYSSDMAKLKKAKLEIDSYL